MKEDSITIWGVELKRLTFTDFTNAVLFATVLFMLSVVILRIMGITIGLNNAFAACFTGAMACELGLEVHRSYRHLVMFLGLASCAAICLRLAALFALAAAGG